MAKGGANSRRALHSVDGAPLPSTLRPILRQLGQVFRDTKAGHTKPEVARACSAVATAMARLVMVGSLEERMTQLEARMATPPPEPDRKTG